MKLRYRILSVVGVVAIAAVTSFAIVVSYNAECGAAVAPPADTPRMKAVMSRRYGSPAVLTVEEVARPAIGDHDRVAMNLHFQRCHADVHSGRERDAPA